MNIHISAHKIPQRHSRHHPTPILQAPRKQDTKNCPQMSFCSCIVQEYLYLPYYSITQNRWRQAGKHRYKPRLEVKNNICRFFFPHILEVISESFLFYMYYYLYEDGIDKTR